MGGLKTWEVLTQINLWRGEKGCMYIKSIVEVKKISIGTSKVNKMKRLNAGKLPALLILYSIHRYWCFLSNTEKPREFPFFGVHTIRFCLRNKKPAFERSLLLWCCFGITYGDTFAFEAKLSASRVEVNASFPIRCGFQSGGWTSCVLPFRWTCCSVTLSLVSRNDSVIIASIGQPVWPRFTPPLPLTKDGQYLLWPNVVRWVGVCAIKSRITDSFGWLTFPMCMPQDPTPPPCFTCDE